jgi:hypothetical protein
VERTDTSTVHKIKETFWTTKQAVIQKLGKKEDAHVVASDAELDSKLEVWYLYYALMCVGSLIFCRGCCGRDRMVVGFTTTYAISAYHH